MRGHVDPQSGMFVYFSPDSRVPTDHPLRSIKTYADAVLGSMSGEFDRLYSSTGRPSIPPERLLKGSLLIALYSVRSDRMFCEMLNYNILFRWFLDMSLEATLTAIGRAGLLERSAVAGHAGKRQLRAGAQKGRSRAVRQGPGTQAGAGASEGAQVRRQHGI